MSLKIGLFILQLVVSSYGLFKMKTVFGESSQLFSADFALGFTAYFLGFPVWVLILARMPLRVAFPSAAGGLIVLTQLIGARRLKGPMHAIHIARIAVIIGGILLVFMKA